MVLVLIPVVQVGSWEDLNKRQNESEDTSASSPDFCPYRRRLYKFRKRPMYCGNTTCYKGIYTTQE